FHGTDARRCGGYDDGTFARQSQFGEGRSTEMTIRSNRMRALLIMLGTAAAVCKSVPIHADDQMITLNPQTLKWIAIPDMPACATAAILRGNPRWGPAWVLLRLTSGCQVPWHWHKANETLLVISGRGTVMAKDG